MSKRGVNVSVVRLPQVHDTVKQGLITYAVQVAREKGEFESESFWITVHEHAPRDDRRGVRW